MVGGKWGLSLYIRNKKSSTLATPVQHCNAGSGQGSLPIERNKRHTHWKGMSKIISILRLHNLKYRKS